MCFGSNIAGDFVKKYTKPDTENNIQGEFETPAVVSIDVRSTECGLCHWLNMMNEQGRRFVRCYMYISNNMCKYMYISNCFIVN